MARPLPISAALAVLLISLAALAPSAAAAGCALDATVQPGRSIDLAGTGFTAGGGVTIGVVRGGTAQPSIAATVDAAGDFTASVDAGPGRGGAYAFSATDGTCTATTEALAVETAGTVGGTAPAGGSGAGVGSGATLPPTDATRSGGRSDAVDGGPLPAGGALLLVGFGSLLVVLSVPHRRRRDQRR